MKELIDAAKKINKILLESEEIGDNFDVTLGKVTGVKVHGVSFPTLMLMEIMEKFNEGFDERRKKASVSDHEEIQKKYDEAAVKWNTKIN
tara:strand:+ start:123 stop:392 length:270 start_codon:yes stop_codon:yes gene_type:complete